MQVPSHLVRQAPAQVENPELTKLVAASIAMYRNVLTPPNIRITRCGTGWRELSKTRRVGIPGRIPTAMAVTKDDPWISFEFEELPS